MWRWTIIGHEIAFRDPSLSFVVTATFATLLAGALTLWILRHYLMNNSLRQISEKNATTTNQIKKRVVQCPFSQNSQFETPSHAPMHPLDLYESWLLLDKKEGAQMPLAARWLNAGLSGQDTPGLLRANLKPMPNHDSRHFLVQEPSRHAHELGLKQKALDRRHEQVFVAEVESRAAQQECLELFLEYLPRYYPSLYQYDVETRTMTVSSIGKSFFIPDWQQRPLELCARMVQEDLVLMRPPSSSPTTKTSTTQSKWPQSYRMAAAAVVFSFDELPDKLGQESQFIHAPVPGFEKHVLKAVNLTLDKLPVNRILWRNNWGLSPDGILDEPERAPPSSDCSHVPTLEQVKTQTWLEVEYQTIRRLSETGYILFTVRTFMDRLDELEKVPNAAACLAASMRGMSPSLLRYKGIENEESRQVILSYLDSIGIGADSRSRDS